MEKFIKILKYLASSFLTMILTTILIVLVLIINLKYSINKNTIEDIVFDKDVINELINEEVLNDLNINNDSLNKVLDNKEIKDKTEDIIGNIINSILKEETLNIDAEELRELVKSAIDEYNKVSSEELPKDIENKIINSLSNDLVASFQEEINNINITNEFNSLFNVLEFILFGEFIYYLIGIILVLVLLIALVNYSYYKWMPYVCTSTSVSAILTLFLGITLSFIKIDNSIVNSFINKEANIFLITSIVLIIISIALVIGHKYIKKYTERNIQLRGDENVYK